MELLPHPLVAVTSRALLSILVALPSVVIILTLEAGAAVHRGSEYRGWSAQFRNDRGRGAAHFRSNAQLDAPVLAADAASTVSAASNPS